MTHGIICQEVANSDLFSILSKPNYKDSPLKLNFLPEIYDNFVLMMTKKDETFSPDEQTYECINFHTC